MSKFIKPKRICTVSLAVAISIVPTLCAGAYYDEIDSPSNSQYIYSPINENLSPDELSALDDNLNQNNDNNLPNLNANDLVNNFPAPLAVNPNVDSLDIPSVYESLDESFLWAKQDVTFLKPTLKPYSWNCNFRNYREKGCDPNYPRYSYTDDELKVVNFIYDNSLANFGIGKEASPEYTNKLIKMLINQRPKERLKRYNLLSNENFIIDSMFDSAGFTSFDDIADFLVKLLCNESKDRWEFDIFDVTKYTNVSKNALNTVLINHWEDIRQNMSPQTLKKLDEKFPETKHVPINNKNTNLQSTNDNEKSYITDDYTELRSESFNRHSWNCNFKKYKEHNCRPDAPRFYYTNNELLFTMFIYNTSLKDLGLRRNDSLYNTDQMVKELIAQKPDVRQKRYDEIKNHDNETYSDMSFNKNELFIMECFLDNLKISSFDDIANLLAKLLYNESIDRDDHELTYINNYTNNSKSALCNLLMLHWEDIRINMSAKTVTLLNHVKKNHGFSNKNISQISRSHETTSTNSLQTQTSSNESTNTCNDNTSENSSFNNEYSFSIDSQIFMEESTNENNHTLLNCEYNGNEIDLIKLIHDYNLSDINIYKSSDPVQLTTTSDEGTQHDTVKEVVEKLIAQKPDVREKRYHDICNSNTYFFNTDANGLFIMECYLDNIGLNSCKTISDCLIKLLYNDSEQSNKDNLIYLDSEIICSKRALCNLLIEHWDDIKENMSQKTLKLLSDKYPQTVNTTVKSTNNSNSAKVSAGKIKNTPVKKFNKHVLTTLKRNGIKTKVDMIGFLRKVCTQRKIECPRLTPNLRVNEIAKTIFYTMMTSSDLNFQEQVKVFSK